MRPSARSPAGPTRNSTASASLIAVFFRIAIAIVVAFVGMTVLRAGQRSARAWTFRIGFSAVAFVLALWMVMRTIPFLLDPSIPIFTIVGSAVLIAGLAAEELVGADVRRRLGI